MPTEEVEVLIEWIAGIIQAVIVVGLVWWIIQIIAKWKIFTKAGQPGWKAIIPIYSDYTTFKIAWKPMLFWI